MASKYKTKQREELIEYLKGHETHQTVNEICGYFREHSVEISMATVYRRLEQLVREGAVNKYIVDANSPACFEYVDREKKCSDRCYHCKCEKCGKLIHMHCDEMTVMEAHFLSEHHFMLDPQRTVFYGICSECAASGS